MPFYSDLRTYENEIKQHASVELLDKLGYTKIPSVQEVAERLFESDAYRSNPVAMRMKSGEWLHDISRETLSKKKFGMRQPWNMEERQSYNTELDSLAGIVPAAWNFEAHTFLHLREPEGSIIWGFSMPYLVFTYVGLLEPSKMFDYPPILGIPLSVIGAGFAVALLSVSLLEKTTDKYNTTDIYDPSTERYEFAMRPRKALNHQIDYVEKALRRK